MIVCPSSPLPGTTPVPLWVLAGTGVTWGEGRTLAPGTMCEDVVTWEGTAEWHRIGGKPCQSLEERQRCGRTKGLECRDRRLPPSPLGESVGVGASKRKAPAPQPPAAQLDL